MPDNPEDRLCTLVTSHLNCADRFRWDASLRDDLGADSLGIVKLAVLLETEFNIEIDDDRADRWQTPADLLETVRELV